MNFLVGGKLFKIKAREWKDDHYEPNCFDDIADGETVGMTYNHECDAWETTQERFDEIVSWWKDEFEKWKNGRNNDGDEFEAVEILMEVIEL